MSKSHRFFFSLSFILFIVVAIFIGYVALQSRQTTNSSAAVTCTDGPGPDIVAPLGDTVPLGNFRIDWKCVKAKTGYFITVNKAPFSASGEASLTCGQNGDECATLEGKFKTFFSYNFDDPKPKYRIRVYSMVGTDVKNPPTTKIVSVATASATLTPSPTTTPPAPSDTPGPGQLTPTPTLTPLPDGCTDRPPVILSPTGNTVPQGNFKVDWRCVKAPAGGYFVTINKAPFSGDDGSSLTCNQNGDVCKQLDGRFNSNITYNFSNATVKYRIKVYATKADGTKLLPAAMKLLAVAGPGGTTLTPSPSATPGPSEPPTTETPPPGGLVNLVLNLKLSFQGIVKKTPTDQMEVKVALVGGTSRHEGTGQFTVGDDGFWRGSVQVNNVEKRNDHYLLVKGPKHIQKRICDFDPTLAKETKPGTYSCFAGHIIVNDTSGTENWDLSGIKLLAGDLPQQDGIVDAYDVSLVRQILTKPLAERSKPENTTLADINLDGVVDTQDYSLVIAALSVRSDDK